jgi:hypothetical protein
VLALETGFMVRCRIALFNQPGFDRPLARAGTEFAGLVF